MIYWSTLLWPDQRLHQPAERVDPAAPNLQDHLHWFFRVVEALKYGMREGTFQQQRFFAAPIFGLRWNLLAECDDKKTDDEGITCRFLVNAEIVDAADRTFALERCPCFTPFVETKQPRPTKLTVEWTVLHVREGSMAWEREEVTYQGALAQQLHHELDHMAGKTMIDPLSSLKKNDVKQRSAWFRDKQYSPLFTQWTTFYELAHGVNTLNRDLEKYMELRKWMKEKYPLTEEGELPHLNTPDLIKTVRQEGKFKREQLMALIGFNLDARYHKLAYASFKELWPAEKET